MRIQRIGILVLLFFGFQSLAMAQSASFASIGCNTLQTNVELAQNESGYILVLSESTIDFNPTDGTGYTINSIFGAGADVSPLLDGEYIVYDGSGNAIITGIPDGTSLFYEVFPYLIVGGSKVYSVATSFSGIIEPIVALDLEYTLVQPTCPADNMGSLTVDIVSGQGDYTWSLDSTSGTLLSTETTATLNMISPGAHTFTLTDAYGCSRVYDFNVSSADSLTAGLINLIPTTCSGDSDGYAEFFVTTAGLSGSVATVGFIQPANVVSSSSGNYEISGLSAGTYDVVYFYQPDSTCTDTLSFTILDGAFTADSEIVSETCDGAADGTISLSNLSGGMGPYTIDWTDASGNSVGTGTDITATAGTYIASISDANGCEYIQEYTIGVDGTNCVGCASTVTANDLYDIFTPNGDMMNETWDVIGLGSCATSKLTICNRWGDKVYEASNLTNNAWDGTGNNGDELPTGAYYYFLELDDDSDPDNILKGVINLVR